MSIKNLVVTYGGRSAEHDVSILSGLHASRHVLGGARVHLVYLDRDNVMWVGAGLGNLDFYTPKNKKKFRGVSHAWFSDGYLYKRALLGRVKRVCKVDVVLNLCHGGVGEAGELASYLEMVNIPITSSQVLGAKKMMSKILTREILVGEDWAQPEYTSISCSLPDVFPQDIVDADNNTSQEWGGMYGILSKFPLIVKPDTLGSSIGISIARDVRELREAVELALLFDGNMIVEEFLEGAIEVNCAGFKFHDDVLVSECEVVNKDGGSLFDFEKKYLGPAPQMGKKHGQEEEIDEGLKPIFDEIKNLTRRAYELFGASGVVRCDFLVKFDDQKLPRIYLNELNSVPGFLAYHLFHRAGMPYGVLIDMVSRQAIDEYKKRTKFEVRFPSEILKNNRTLVE